MTDSQANSQLADAFRIIIRLGLFSLLLSALIVTQFRVAIFNGLRTGDFLPIEYVVHQQANSEQTTISGIPWHRAALINYKMQSVLARQPEIIVMGSSRMMFFQEQAFINGRQTFYNAQINSSTSAQLLQIVEYLVAQDTLPEILILGLDFPSFNLQYTQIDEASSLPPIRSYYQTQWDYYITRLLAEDEPFDDMPSEINTYRLIGSLALSDYDGYINDGSRIRIKISPEEYLITHREWFTERVGTYSVGTDVDLQAVENVRKLLAILAEHDVHVIGIFPPYHADFWQEISTTEDYTYIEPTIEALQNVFDDYGYPLFDYSDVSQLTDDNEMWDGWHPGALLSTRIVQDIAEQTAPLMDDYVDYEALETIIANADDPFFVFYDFNFEDFPTP